jgi:hypothetical protein
MLTCVIDMQEDRDIAVVDNPNAFVQTVVDEEDAEHRVLSEIAGCAACAPMHSLFPTMCLWMTALT